MLKSNTRKYLLTGAGLSLTASLLVGCNNAGGGASAGGATSGGATVATVNGTNIGREDLRTYLEAKGGPQVLRQLIDFELVMQHAKTAGLEVTDAELDAAIAAQQQQNPQMAQSVKNGGAALETLRREMRYQLALDKLLTKDIKVDAAAQQKWFEKNRARYDKPAQVKAGILFSSTKQRADVMAQQLKTKGKSFLDLVNEQKKANDMVAKSSFADSSESATPGMAAPAFLPIDALPPALKQAVEKLKPTETSGVVEIKGAQTAYAIILLKERQEAVKAKAGDPLPTQEYKLEQVARKALVKLPVNPQTKKKPTFEEYSAQAQQYLQQQNMQQGRMEPPTQRDVLNLINQAEVQRVLTEVRGKANVTSADPVYAAVVKEYQPVPTAAPPAGAPDAAAGGAPPAGNAAGNASGNAAGNAATAPAAP